MKSTAFLICMFSLAPSAFAQFESNTPSQVSGLTISNAHSVDPSNLIFRGSEPSAAELEQLVQFNIQNVLIVKKQNRTEVDKEITFLSSQNIESAQAPIDWKNPETETTCLQVVEAVQYLQKAKARGEKTFFHCTAGEDRTGLVAGIFRMADQKWTASRAFKEEMCANGYSDGKQGKGYNVTSVIETTLTPVFITLSQYIEKNRKLGPDACNSLATLTAKTPKPLRCGSRVTSARFK